MQELSLKAHPAANVSTLSESAMKSRADNQQGSQKFNVCTNNMMRHFQLGLSWLVSHCCTAFV